MGFLSPAPALDLLDRVQASLGPREAMVSFQLADDRDAFGREAGGTWIWVSTRQGTRAHRLEGDQRPTDSWLERFRDVNSTWEPEDLEALYKVLLEAALDQLPVDIDRLVLVPDGALHLVPFATLGSQGEEPLAGRYELSYAPSAALWLYWRQHPADGFDPSALVFADPEPPDWALEEAPSTARGAAHRLGELPHARQEGQRVARYMGTGSRLLTGLEASESFLRDVDLDPFAILHFATHAVANTRSPETSGVLLSDGWLHPAEIARLDLRGKVIVLSTCESATGALRRGEGVVSLARAFFVAGAQAVVGTLRPLPDNHGRQFFETFYQGLGRGLSLRRALASTQRRWIAEGRPATTWASIVLLGNGDFTPAAGGVSPTPYWLPRFLWAALALLAALILARLLRRRRG